MYVLGTIEMRNVPSREALCLEEFYQEVVSALPTFKRLSRDGEVLFCKNYSRVKRRNSYTVSYMTSCECRYGHIMYFTLLKNQPAAVIRRLSVLPNGDQFLPTRAVFPVEVSVELEVIHISEIKEKVIFMSISDTASYIAKFPSSLNVD